MKLLSSKASNGGYGYPKDFLEVWKASMISADSYNVALELHGIFYQNWKSPLYPFVTSYNFLIAG